MLKVIPDWTATMTIKEAEATLANFKFDGSGWYLADTESILATPVLGTIYNFYLFKCPLRETIYSTYPLVVMDKRNASDTQFSTSVDGCSIGEGTRPSL